MDAVEQQKAELVRGRNFAQPPRFWRQSGALSGCLDAKGAPIPQVSSSSRAQVHPCYFLLAASVIVDRFTATPF